MPRAMSAEPPSTPMGSNHHLSKSSLTRPACRQKHAYYFWCPLRGDQTRLVLSPTSVFVCSVCTLLRYIRRSQGEMVQFFPLVYLRPRFFRPTRLVLS